MSIVRDYSQWREERLLKLKHGLPFNTERKINHLWDHKGILEVYWKTSPSKNDLALCRHLWEELGEVEFTNYLIKELL